jgi:AcrR family transcriptional regulator
VNPQSRRRQLHKSFKAELKELALDLFAKRGYERTSYRDIAFTAGISLRVMPRYFREKENILLDDLDEGAKAFRGALLAQPRSLPPIKAFERAMISAEYPPYHLEYLLAAVICREQSSKLSAAFNEFRLRWQTEVAAAIAEWLGISNKTEFPPIFWSSTILTALEHILRAQAGEAGLAAELTDPAEVFALVFDNLRMMAVLTASGVGVPHSLPATTLQLVI